MKSQLYPPRSLQICLVKHIASGFLSSQLSSSEINLFSPFLLMSNLLELLWQEILRWEKLKAKSNIFSIVNSFA